LSLKYILQCHSPRGPYISATVDKDFFFVKASLTNVWDHQPEREITERTQAKYGIKKCRPTVRERKKPLYNAVLQVM
jgi:hypothetical protein